MKVRRRYDVARVDPYFGGFIPDSGVEVPTLLLEIVDGGFAIDWLYWTENVDRSG